MEWLKDRKFLNAAHNLLCEPRLRTGQERQGSEAGKNQSHR